MSKKTIREIEFNDLFRADLIIDAVYKGGKKNTSADDPISRLLQTGNMGGFRHRGRITPSDLNLVALTSSMDEPEWPDYLDVELGQFVYFGDNRHPGRELHDTNKQGNLILRDIFNNLHVGQRDKVPPVFVFTKGAVGRDVIFRGLAVPGSEGVSATEDLIAVWKSMPEGRFQNYKALFTILDVQSISRKWIDSVKHDRLSTMEAPPEWLEWRQKGVYRTLRAKKSRIYRTKEEQLPSTQLNKELVTAVHEFFKSDPCAFEKCAAELARMMEKNIVDYELTRRWVDGGRDAIGRYRIGNKDNSIYVDFALEAKNYKFTSAATVKDTTRLISRLRYRQFGIFVTTSFVHHQAYKEITEDQHPVIVISAEDIANILKSAGYGTVEAVRGWLEQFPRNQ